MMIHQHRWSEDRVGTVECESDLPTRCGQTRWRCPRCLTVSPLDAERWTNPHTHCKGGLNPQPACVRCATGEKGQFVWPAGRRFRNL